MRLLWIAPQAFYSARGTPMNVRRLASVMAAAGHSIDLVTYGIGEDVTLPSSVRLVRAPRLPLVRRVAIGPSLVKILLDALVLWRAHGLLRRSPRGYDAIQGFEEGAWIAWLLSRGRGVPFVYDMDSDIEAQIADSAAFRFLLPLARSIDRAAVRSSLAVLTVCTALSDRVRSVAPGKPLFQIEDAPNVAPSADRASSRRELASRWALPDGPWIVYTGNLEPYQGVELLVRAAPRVLAERPEASILVVGGAPKQVAGLRALAEQVGASRIVFAGERPEEEMSAVLAAADVLVSPRILGANTPLKLYAYLASGRPVVASDRPVHTQVVSANEAVLAAPTPEGIALGILSVLRDPERAAALAANAAALVAARYSTAAFADKTRAFAAGLGSLVGKTEEPVAS